MTDNKISIGYWKFHGKVSPARYLLELSSIPYNDALYTDPAEWFGKDKHSLGLPFPNLPYLLHGDIRLTESEALTDYLLEYTQK